jgi:hypothetical protein
MVLTIATVLMAAAPTARLEVWATPTAVSCPSAQEIQASLAERLGRDVVSPDGEIALEVRFDRDERGFTVVLSRTDGETMRKRTLSTPGDSCAPLAESVVLAFALILEPVVRRAPAPAPRQASLAPVETSAPVERPRANWFASLGLGGQTGLGPSFGFAPTVQGAVAWSRFSLGLSVAGLLPGAGAARGGVVETSATFGTLIPCYELAVAQLCGVVSAGSFRAQGIGFAQNTTEQSPLVLAGVRAAVRLPEQAWWFGQGWLELALPLTRITVTVDGSAAWAMPLMALSIGVSFGVRTQNGNSADSTTPDRHP